MVLDYNDLCNFNLTIFFQIRLSDLITARILRYTDFDTLIYTCAPEFDFMEKAVCFFCFVKCSFESETQNFLFRNIQLTLSIFLLKHSLVRRPSLPALLHVKAVNSGSRLEGLLMWLR